MNNNFSDRIDFLFNRKKPVNVKGDPILYKVVVHRSGKLFGIFEANYTYYVVAKDSSSVTDELRRTVEQSTFDYTESIHRLYPVSEELLKLINTSKVRLPFIISSGI